MNGPLFHVVLHEPEIPNNTGNIGRTCLAAGCALHLIRPLGFDTSVKALRRAGLDYWPRLNVREHESWEAYVRAMGIEARETDEPSAPARGSWGDSPRSRSGLGPSRAPAVWLTSAKLGRPVWDADLRRGDHLVFGKETSGLPEWLLERYAQRVLTLPMVPGERGLNLATAVCAVVYEGIRQCAARGEAAIGADGRVRI